MVGAERAVERLRRRRLDASALMPPDSPPVARSSYPSSSLTRLAEDCPVGLTGGRRTPRASLGPSEQDRGARLVDVPGAGHAVQMAKNVFVDALLALAHDADLDPADQAQ